MKLGFIHIPKTGGSSVLAWLNQNHIDHFNRYHSRLCELGNQRADVWFTLVRCPFQRMISSYEFAKVKYTKMLSKQLDSAQRDHYLQLLGCYHMGFDYWLSYQLEHDAQTAMTQCDYMDHAAMHIDIVIKLEQISQRWWIIQQLTGCHNPLPVVKHTVRSRSNYYTKTSIKMVCDRFHDDFVRFGYALQPPTPGSMPVSDIVQPDLLAPWFEIPHD